MFNVLTSAAAKTLFAFLVLSSTTLFANPTAPAKPASFDASFYVNKANKIRLAVAKTDVEPVSISLKAVGDSNVLFTRQMSKKQTKLSLQLNVDDLADGTYELEVKSATGSIIKRVNLSSVTPQNATERMIQIP